MKNWIRKRKKLLTIIAVIILVLFAGAWVVGLDPTASFRGRMMARYDLAWGHYKILAYGLPPPYSNEYARLLHERYGIEYEQSALCIVSPALVNYVDSYDSVSSAAAQRKFGPDIFEKTFAEARQHWNAMHPGQEW